MSIGGDLERIPKCQRARVLAFLSFAEDAGLVDVADAGVGVCCDNWCWEDGVDDNAAPEDMFIEDDGEAPLCCNAIMCVAKEEVMDFERLDPRTVDADGRAERVSGGISSCCCCCCCCCCCVVESLDCD